MGMVLTSSVTTITTHTYTATGGIGPTVYSDAADERYAVDEVVVTITTESEVEEGCDPITYEVSIKGHRLTASGHVDARAKLQTIGLDRDERNLFLSTLGLTARYI